ncbi:hypothetical protein QAD02_012680 [Eretmocerus hayati]|uniref:Uncharacterized protein n=1 Tax=Eretmocerus hayati TaxID=131215 RepID=A0ACC2P1B5_9HYME|nr:hypothetical protein QAD02_012680 [Eretmocerus hayati]
MLGTLDEITYVTYLQNHGRMAAGQLNELDGKNQKKNQWDRLANDIGVRTGLRTSADSLKRREVKGSAKKKWAAIHYPPTGNESEEGPDLEEETLEVLSIVGTSHGFGLPLVPEVGTRYSKNQDFGRIDYDLPEIKVQTTPVRNERAMEAQLSVLPRMMPFLHTRDHSVDRTNRNQEKQSQRVRESEIAEENIDLKSAGVVPEKMRRESTALRKIASAISSSERYMRDRMTPIAVALKLHCARVIRNTLLYFCTASALRSLRRSLGQQRFPTGNRTHTTDRRRR